MTTTTLSNSSLSRKPARSGASAGLGHRIWDFLTSLGSRRASSQLNQLARHYDASRPELARTLREAARSGLNG